MEDTQNSAPETLEATKLIGAGQRGDTQSVTKRFVIPSFQNNPSFTFARSTDLSHFDRIACKPS